MNNNFDAWAEKRYPLASRQDSLGGFSRDMRKSALEGFEVATALSGVVIAKQAMQLKALAADNQRLREALIAASKAYSKAQLGLIVDAALAGSKGVE